MPTNAPNTSGSPYVLWGGVLAVASIVTVVGGAIIWSHRDPVPKNVALAVSPDDSVAPRPLRRTLPPLPIDPNISTLHTVEFAVENGTAVVKIKVVADGDELVVDANTGRLIETRPGRLTQPAPAGKFAAPFAPLM